MENVEYIPKRGATVLEENNEDGVKVATSVATPEQLANLEHKKHRGQMGFEDAVDESKSKTHFPGRRPGIFDCDCGAHFSGKGAEGAFEAHCKDEHAPNWSPREQWDAQESLVGVEAHVSSQRSYYENRIGDLEQKLLIANQQPLVIPEESHAEAFGQVLKSMPTPITQATTESHAHSFGKLLKEIGDSLGNAIGQAKWGGD